MSIAAFIIALVLLGGGLDPTRGWLIALVALTGLAAMRWRFWAPWALRPALDLRLAAFVLAVLLLAGTIDATRDWLIGLSVATGLAAFMPRILSLEGDYDGRGWHDRHRRGPRSWRRERQWRSDRRRRRRDRRDEAFWDWEAWS